MRLPVDSPEVPERYNFARDVLDALADDPERLALWSINSAGDERKLTFADLSQLSRRACNLLKDQGIVRGDVIVVVLPRIAEWWILNIACLRMGAIISPGSIQLTAADLEHRLRESRAACIIADAGVAVRVGGTMARCGGIRCKLVVGGQAPGWRGFSDLLATSSPDFETAHTRADEVASIYFTSGTTGPPKMVAHTQSSFPLRHKVTGAHWLDLHPGDLHWNLGDTGWAKAAWSSIYGPWNQAAAVFAVDAPRFDPRRALRVLSRFPIDTMCAPPTVYRSLLAESGGQIRPRTLRHCVAAGEPLEAPLLEAWRAATGITIRDGYGQTETSLLLANAAGAETRVGSMGKPVPGYDVQIIDASGEALAAGLEGDIAVRVAPRRPLGIFREYWKDPGATAATRRGDWLVTGDRAYRDEDGYFWYVGRADDVIITSGYRVGPFEVESALQQHEAVREAAAVSSPDEARGAIVKAFVVLAPGSAPGERLARELQEHVKRITAPYKYPRAIEFVDVLPKTASGKPRRAALREREWNDR